MKLAACSMLTLLVACSTQTEDLGHTVTTHGFGATRWEVGTAGVLRYVTIDVHGDVVVASDGAVEKRSGADGSSCGRSRSSRPPARSPNARAHEARDDRPRRQHHRGRDVSELRRGRSPHAGRGRARTVEQRGVRPQALSVGRGGVGAPRVPRDLVLVPSDDRCQRDGRRRRANLRGDELQFELRVSERERSRF